MNVHPIRRKILQNLSRSASLRFNDIKDFDIDPRNFVYHLEKLEKDGFVKYDYKLKRYSLTNIGKKLSANERSVFTPIETFIGLLIERNSSFLVVKRKRSPYLDHTGVPVFLPSFENFLHESASESLNSLGLDGKLMHILLIETIYKSNKDDIEVTTHSNMHIFYCNDSVGTPIDENCEGTLLWMDEQSLLGVKKGYNDTVSIIEYLDEYKADVTKENCTKVISKVDSETTY